MNITPNHTNINILYYNDLHGSTKYLDSFLKAQDDYHAQNPTTPMFTLCGGDMFVDVNSNNEVVARKIATKTDAISVGNHDLEGGNYLAYLIKKFNLNKKFLSVNLEFEKPTPLTQAISSSNIIENNGEKIGIIGVSPLDFNQLTFMNDKTDFIKTKNLSLTIQAVRNEVKKLTSQKINKIFLLAHTGNNDKKNNINYYKQFAKIGGIDVIIGGHDHIETDYWAQSELGEPVKIIATGKSDKHEFNKNLNIIGKLNLKFNKNGVLIKENCQNKFETLQVTNTTGTETAVYVLESPLKNSDPLTENSEAANIIADSNLWYVNSHTKGKKADCAIVNAGTIRDNIETEYITCDDIKSLVPFTTSTLIKAPLSKRQIINTLNWCALSTGFGKITPGLMHTAGMEYTVNENLTVSDVHILNNDGSIKYNLDDYCDDKKFLVVYDVFLATGVAGLNDLKKDKYDSTIEYFNTSRQDALIEYFKHNSQIHDYKKERIHFSKIPSLV